MERILVSKKELKKVGITFEDKIGIEKKQLKNYIKITLKNDLVCSILTNINEK